MSSPATSKPIILCPLKFERDALAKRSSLASRCRIICCGPGAQGINAWADSAVVAEAPVILAGLAGALDDHLPRSIACTVDAVIDARTGARWQPSAPVPEIPGVPHASLTSVDEIIADLAAKRTLHERSGAALVDLESVAFATRASALGWSWAIVRGISDAAGDALPRDIGAWVSGSGRQRPLAIARSILRNPMTIRRLIELQRSGARAMQAVARVLEAWFGTG